MNAYRLKVHLHGAELQELKLDSGREYTFGRGESCDVQLRQDKSGISRIHFRLIEEQGQWTAQVVSKFGAINHSGQPVRILPLESGMVFKIGPYDFHYGEAEQVRESFSLSNTLPVAVGQSDHHGMPAQEPEPEAPDFDGNDEATRVAAFEPEVPYLRIVDPRGTSEMKLEGRRWIAGREDSCSVLLNDRKASRRQFELTSTPQGYFVRDLGSSNGTLLNGMPLAPDELKAIRSGDVIQVGSVVLHFEVRDPHFQTKLMVVPPQTRSEYGIVVQSPYEMINYPIASGPGGAVRVDGKNWLARFENVPIPFTDNLDEAKKKKVRFWVLVAIVLIPLILIGSLSGNEKPVKSDKKENIEFVKLSPQQQREVMQIYALAQQLYIQQKLALAGDQLERLHKIIPTGYMNSIAMAGECAAQKQYEAELRRIEDDKRRQEEIRRTVESAVRNCEPLSRRTLSLDEMNVCLRPALEHDPENGMVRDLIGRVRARIEANTISEKNKADYARRVAKGKALYERAFTLEGEGEYLDALEAYKKHAEAAYPDPQGLKQLSQKQIFSIEKRLSSKVEDTLRAAEAAYAVGNFRESLDHVAKAKRMDPRNRRASELNAKYRNELRAKLREIYEESVISEGLGQIDEAKTKWKRITEMDTTDGEYYNKARNKLRAYGSFGN